MPKPGLALKFNPLGIVTFLVLCGLGYWWGRSAESALWSAVIYAGVAASAFVISFVCIRK